MLLQAITSFDATFRQEDGLLTISSCAPGNPVEYTPLPRGHWWSHRRRTLGGMTKTLREHMKVSGCSQRRSVGWDGMRSLFIYFIYSQVVGECYK